MSTAGIASLALFAPVVASNAVFSARRAKRGVDAIDENPMFALANFDIATAQVVKGGRAAKALAVAMDPSLEMANMGAAETIKAASKTNPFVKGLGKVINFTADNINPVIIGAGAIKVLGSDDKLDAAARESASLMCMFGAEAAAKQFIGMPITKKVDGKTISIKRDGLYKDLFSQKQIEAMNDFFMVDKKMSECTTFGKKMLKAAPGVTKGLLFVGASIAGYKIGDKIGDAILGKKEKTLN